MRAHEQYFGADFLGARSSDGGLSPTPVCVTRGATGEGQSGMTMIREGGEKRIKRKKKNLD